ncbi:glycerophosphoryl diester phosphodiesterase [Artemisia annua]|uniref:Glycerophosphoryl diester phosphodiesterase n=1 Tax=Artemisia annua TaxID=35608 RepID=A0A2U1MIL4_ARTAN|nr:glycerophosphoryl diester phosphodiesterase [Artemisia annua]
MVRLVDTCFTNAGMHSPYQVVVVAAIGGVRLSEPVRDDHPVLVQIKRRDALTQRLRNLSWSTRGPQFDWPKARGNRHELVYEVNKNIRGALYSTILEITEFANSVIISKESIHPKSNEYLYGQSYAVQKLQASKLHINTYVTAASVVTDYVVPPPDTEDWVVLGTAMGQAVNQSRSVFWDHLSIWNKCLSLPDDQVARPKLMPPPQLPVQS